MGCTFHPGLYKGVWQETHSQSAFVSPGVKVGLIKGKDI